MRSSSRATSRALAGRASESTAKCGVLTATHALRSGGGLSAAAGAARSRAPRRSENGTGRSDAPGVTSPADAAAAVPSLRAKGRPCPRVGAAEGERRVVQLEELLWDALGDARPPSILGKGEQPRDGAEQDDVGGLDVAGVLGEFLARHHHETRVEGGEDAGQVLVAGIDGRARGDRYGHDRHVVDHGRAAPAQELREPQRLHLLEREEDVGLAEADVLLSFEKMEALRFAQFLRRGGTVVVNDMAIVPVTVSSGTSVYPGAEHLARVFATLDARLVMVPGEKLAQDAGNVKAANVVLLGA